MKRKPHAFTLTELMIVVSIIGVMGALAIVKYNSIKDAQSARIGFDLLKNEFDKVAAYILEHGTYVGSSSVVNLNSCTNNWGDLQFTPNSSTCNDVYCMMSICSNCHCSQNGIRIQINANYGTVSCLGLGCTAQVRRALGI